MMADVGPKALESLQAVFFFKTPRSLDVEHVVGELKLPPLESVEKRGPGGPSTAIIKAENWTVTLSAAPTRLELAVAPVFHPPVMIEQELPQIGTHDLDGMSNFFSNLAEKLFAVAAPVVRIGIVAQAVQPFRTQELAAQTMKGEVPFNVDLPANTYDFGIQFNARSMSTNGIELNNLQAWQTLKHQFLSITGAGIKVAETFVGKYTLDTNTVAENNYEFEGENGLQTLKEMISLAANRIGARIK